MTDLKSLAIKKALENNWEEAYSLNETLLQQNPTDIDTLNRAAFALIKLGKIKQSKDTYKKVLDLDPTNPIALKNLKKINSVSQKQLISNTKQQNNSHIKIEEFFIEEAGRTKVVELKNIADKATLSVVQPGDIVNLVIKRSKIFVQNQTKKYIGMLPDNIGTRLIPFIKGGNEYIGFVRAIDNKNVTIFIKETKRAKRFKNQPSFTSSYSSATIAEYESQDK